MSTVGGTYRFGYGAFGLCTSVSIDGHGTLATYLYNEETVDDRKKDLDALDYGNGVRVNYTYDTWGNPITATGNTAISTLNPLRYRSYIYDTETGLYYLQSRYYDPETGRFINADVLYLLGRELQAITYSPTV